LEIRNKSEMPGSNVPNRRITMHRVWNVDVCRICPLSAVFVLVLTVLNVAYAAPPDFAQVPSDAVWIVHADFDALHKSTVYQKLSVAALARWKPLAAHLTKINRQLGMDVAKDVHGVTVFGPSLAGPKAMLVMRADWDPQVFRQKLAMAPSHAITAAGQYEIHRFTRKDEGQVRTVAGVCWRPGTFLFGQTPGDVQSGLEVLDGRKPNVAGQASGHTSPLAAEVPRGTVVVARMIFSGEALPIESPVLKQTDEIDVACGEDSGECFVRAKLLAKTTEAADQVKKAVDGILAILKLQAVKDAKAKKLLDRLAITVEGRIVQIDFRAAASELATVLETAMQELDKAAVKKD
jgi:hypothetical protein